MEEPDRTEDPIPAVLFTGENIWELIVKVKRRSPLDNIGPTIRSEHHGNIEYRRLSREHGGIITEELDAGLQERRLTPRECALIQTFPPDYTFVSHKRTVHVLS